ncbi:helix-turn-helix domain-containing protein [Maridesulfovibrio sp.]|uniref:helix-turn-helix domain-containing protein n=1 Tax=Maridesulfovibrio sp. TaxID=2795000 RepID=UPI0029CA75C0|nr:helix-turn-helix domain-containing protein [Maridesulfovibrio sp.]
MGIESLSPEDVRRELREAALEAFAPAAELEELRRKLSVTQEQASKLTGIPEGTLKNMRCRREGPPFSKIGSKVVYRTKDLEAYLEATGQKTKVVGSKTNAC